MIYASQNEQHIAEHMVADRREGLVQLYARYAPCLLGFISNLVPEKKLAEELLQRSFMEIWARRDEVRQGKEHFFCWMIKVTRSLVLSKLPLKQNIINEKILNSVIFVNINGGLERMTADTAANTCPQQDTDLQTTAFDLVYLYGFSVTDVSELLHTTVDEIKKILRSAMSKYKKAQHG